MIWIVLCTKVRPFYVVWTWCTTCESVMIATTCIYETFTGQQERLEIGYWHSTFETLRGPPSVLCGLGNKPASVWDSFRFLPKRLYFLLETFWFLHKTFLPLRGPHLVLCVLGKKQRASVGGLGNSVQCLSQPPPLPQMIRDRNMERGRRANQFGNIETFSFYC